jgi:hypothetical protein
MDFLSWGKQTPVSLSRRADLIILTDKAVENLNQTECRALIALGKPIVFGTPADEAEFHRRETEGLP